MLDYELSPPMSSEMSLGAYLRRYRETAGLSVERVSARSRIVPRVIRALEEDRDDLLPAPVYVRGFIRAYCAEVGAPADEALARYDARVAPRPSAPPEPAAPPARRRRRLGAAAAALAIAGLAVAGSLLWLRGVQSPALGGRPETSVTALGSQPPPAGPARPAPPPSASWPSGDPPHSTERVPVMRAVDPTWVRVTPEDGRPTEEVLAPGAVRQSRSAGRFRVTLGNAGDVELELDGRVLPALGERGDVVRDAVIPGERTP
jgi:hypothetical protein